MGASPHRAPFQERIARLEAQLRLVSDVLEQWLALQRAWTHLEPVFASADIREQLPAEARRFAAADRAWRRQMDAARRAPGVLKACCAPRALAGLEEAARSLEAAQKGLADYLGAKRLAFARFFFLSDDELLQILSQARDPRAVQPHLRKCFEAVAALEFGPAPDLEITAMASAEGERVPFDAPLRPAGGVERWLGGVEARMRSSVRAQIAAALAAYGSKPRPQWALEWPAMAVLAVAQLQWSAGAEAAIAGGALPAFLAACGDDLRALTRLARAPLGARERIVVGSLITIDVHARDVAQELVDAGALCVRPSFPSFHPLLAAAVASSFLVLLLTTLSTCISSAPCPPAPTPTPHPRRPARERL